MPGLRLHSNSCGRWTAIERRWVSSQGNVASSSIKSKGYRKQMIFSMAHDGPCSYSWYLNRISDLFYKEGWILQASSTSLGVDWMIHYWKISCLPMKCSSPSFKTPETRSSKLFSDFWSYTLSNLHLSRTSRQKESFSCFIHQSGARKSHLFPASEMIAPQDLEEHKGARNAKVSRH